MTIKETVNILMRHSICVKNMNTCDKQCSICSMSVQDHKLLEAYDTALDALAICSGTDSYRQYVEKGA